MVFVMNTIAMILRSKVTIKNHGNHVHHKNHGQKPWLKLPGFYMYA